MLKRILILTISGASLIAAEATAQTATLGVSLDVTAGCEINVDGAGTSSGATPTAALGFGAVSVFGPDAAESQTPATVTAQVGTGAAGGAGTVTIRCADLSGATLSPTFEIGAGSHSEDGAQRRMLSDNDADTFVAYDLFAAAAESDPWVPGETHAVTLTDGEAAIPIFGVARNVSTSATFDGDYRDSVTMTLAY